MDLSWLTSPTVDAVIASLIFSHLIVVIDVTSSAKSRICDAYTPQGWLYTGINCLGNVIATLSAVPLVPEISPKWFFQAFIGVFGFEVIIQNLNISLRDKGVLTINDWITKAKLSAIAAAVEANAEARRVDLLALASRLKAQLSIAELNAYVASMISAETPNQLLKIATDSGADESLVKAFALAQADYANASKIVR